MADTRFYKNTGPITVGRMAEVVGFLLPSGLDTSSEINGVAPLDLAGPGDVSFINHKKHLNALQASKAGYCFVPENVDWLTDIPDTVILFSVQNPQKAYAKLATMLYESHKAHEGIDVRAIVHPSAIIGEGTTLAPGAVIEANVEIGDNSSIGSNTVIGYGVKIGCDCHIHHNVTITHTLIGDRVQVHHGTQIGQDGFGYVSDAEGHFKIPQLGRVIIQDDVEIGTNTTIDRGAAEDTVIGAGTKIDNLVHVAHNCKIGRNCILVTMVGISGSVNIGDGVVLAGKVGVADHLTIGDGAQVAARGSVMTDLEGGKVYGGMPAKPINDWKRENVIMARLVKESRKPKKK